MRIVEENDIHTRKDIKQWIILPANGYVKNVSYPKPQVKKKYRQLKIWETCASNDRPNMLEGEEMRENLVQENNQIHEISDNYLQAMPNLSNAPIGTWFKKILGTWKKQETHVPNEMEEIVVVSSMDNIPIRRPDTMIIDKNLEGAGMEK